MGLGWEEHDEREGGAVENGTWLGRGLRRDRALSDVNVDKGDESGPGC